MPPLEDVVRALRNAVADLPAGPSGADFAGVLRLFLHFAKQRDALAVVTADGHLLAWHALNQWPDSSSDANTVARELLLSLGQQHVAERVLRGPFTPPAGTEDVFAGSQRLSARLEAARRRRERKNVGRAPEVAAITCGGIDAAALLIRARGSAALCAELFERCEAEAAAPNGVKALPLPLGDKRRVAGCETGVFATQRLPPLAVVGPYAAWVTCSSELEQCVPLVMRDEFEQRCVASEAVGLRDEQILFVAHPQGVANATSQLNDWRANPEDSTAGDEGRGPNAALIEVVCHGWPHLFVVTTRAVESGDELSVEYPPQFWAGRAAARLAQRSLNECLA